MSILRKINFHTHWLFAFLSYFVTTELFSRTIENVCYNERDVIRGNIITGEIGKQMFIVNRGTLHVLGDDGRSVLATLRAGSYFGELSILNLGRYGNRRTASVRSLGYSDLFRLSKSDLWDVLKEYPAARRKLESLAYKKISDYRVSMPRDQRGKSGTHFHTRTKYDCFHVHRVHSYPFVTVLDLI